MQTLQRSPGHGLRIAGERATVRADIVISYSIAEGHWEELERREGVAMTLGKINMSLQYPTTIGLFHRRGCGSSFSAGRGRIGNHEGGGSVQSFSCTS